ncbi:MAG: glucose-1-phosphate adenylyltransferase subunit GlgD [Ruminococcaceae bacterium]|nr:glucose-1-phosphate adenylyltransferase subunit GlgD [Oscillospiraceae bacterium]
MRNYTALGLIFPNMHDDAIRDCTAVRSFGSLPFGGRYRLIDFVLSSMVNAGIIKVGVLTKSHYQSLMDHLGSGKAWDLSRKNEGLYFLPPLSNSDAKYQGRISSLADVMTFLHRSKEKLVVLSDCHMVSSIDYSAMIRAHEESGAEITMAYRRGVVPPLADIPQIQVDGTGRVTDMLLGRMSAEEALYGTGIYVVRKDWLMRVVNEAVARNQYHFERDILQGRLHEIALYGYEVPEWMMPIYSLESYYQANLQLLDAEVRRQLFPKSRPVYTKLRDCAPAQYGLHAKVENSLVADGAHIEGTVRNSIVFRGVTVGRDSVLEDCVVMQDVTVDRHCSLRCVMADKNALFREGRTLQGFDSYPVYIKKNAVV